MRAMSKFLSLLLILFAALAAPCAHGENIASGYRSFGTAQEIFEGRCNSPGHYQNMVRENFYSIGNGRSAP